MHAIRHILTLLVLAIFLGACAQRISHDQVVLWTAFEGPELESLQVQISDFEKQSGQKVSLLKVPFASLQRKVLVAGPALQGPDILIGPHDWIGLLETAGLLAPIPDSVLENLEGDVYSVAQQAVTYDEQNYSVPMMMDCVVLARNTELCPNSPQDIGGLVKEALRCQDEPNDALGFAYELDNLYFTWPFLAGFGTDFLDPFSRKALDLEALNFQTNSAKEGIEWVSDLRLRHKLVLPGMKNQDAVDLFLNKKLGMMLCGPWNLGAIKKAGIPYILEPLPSGPRAESSPFVGVTGAMLNKHSLNKPGVEELLQFLGSKETSSLLCKASGRAPARKSSESHLKTILSEEASIRDLLLFSKAAQKGTPLPNHPALSAVWAPLEEALELITTGQSQASEELARTTERVRTKIRFMTE